MVCHGILSGFCGMLFLSLSVVSSIRWGDEPKTEQLYEHTSSLSLVVSIMDRPFNPSSSSSAPMVNPSQVLWFRLGCLGACIGVFTGAFGAHGLKSRSDIGPYELEVGLGLAHACRKILFMPSRNLVRICFRYGRRPCGIRCTTPLVWYLPLWLIRDQVAIGLQSASFSVSSYSPAACIVSCPSVA